MRDFIRGVTFIGIEYSVTFEFYKRGIYKLLKCLSIAIFIIPATVISVLTIICGFINIILGRILIIGTIWSFLVCGILNVIQMLLFRLCNIFELKEYRSLISYALIQLEEI